MVAPLQFQGAAQPVVQGAKGGTTPGPGTDKYGLYNPYTGQVGIIPTTGSLQTDILSQIYDAYHASFGRDPTVNELSQAQAIWTTGQPHSANTSGGYAYVANLAQQAQNTPEALQAKAQQQAQTAYSGNQSAIDSQTNGVFNQLTGRNATSDELSHFGQLLASNQIDQYGLSQLVGQTQEAQQKQTQNYQNQLSTNLQSTQGDYFKNYIAPTILSQTAAAGRDPNSSGVQNALAQAGKQQNYDLQNYLAQFGAGQYGQSAQNQQGVYQQYLTNLYGTQNANIEQQIGNSNANYQQQAQSANNAVQTAAYNDYLSRYGKQASGVPGLIGGGIGGVVGGIYGGPAGAAAGYSVGSGLGSAVGGAVSGNQGGYSQPPSSLNYSGLGKTWGSPFSGSSSQYAPPQGMI